MIIYICGPQAARSALNGEDSLVQLRKDWSMMDLQLILANTLFTLERQQIPMEYLCFIPHCKFQCTKLCELSFRSGETVTLGLGGVLVHSESALLQRKSIAGPHTELSLATM